VNKQTLIEHILKKQSYLCVGLDTDITKIPAHLGRTTEGLLAFNREIIEATRDYCVSYKLNTAFYESLGAKGWELMQQTLELIPSTHLTIADAKRGDIGNTSGMYARAFFDKQSGGLEFDAITAAPYMGKDSLEPFFQFSGKWVIILGLTSNPGSADFEQLSVGEQTLYERVISTFATPGSEENTMFVIGATKAETFTEIRILAPNHFYLVPGVGAQGGDLMKVAEYGMNKEVGLLVNASRSILYASSGEDFADAARAEALALQQQMKETLERFLHH
jgi:orotidine-5'-phosphate decarboxylase